MVYSNCFIEKPPLKVYSARNHPWPHITNTNTILNYVNNEHRTDAEIFLTIVSLFAQAV